MTWSPLGFDSWASIIQFVAYHSYADDTQIYLGHAPSNYDPILYQHLEKIAGCSYTSFNLTMIRQKSLYLSARRKNKTKTKTKA